MQANIVPKGQTAHTETTVSELSKENHLNKKPDSFKDDDSSLFNEKMSNKKPHVQDSFNFDDILNSVDKGKPLPVVSKKEESKFSKVESNKHGLNKSGRRRWEVKKSDSFEDFDFETKRGIGSGKIVQGHGITLERKKTFDWEEDLFG